MHVEQMPGRIIGRANMGALWIALVLAMALPVPLTTAASPAPDLNARTVKAVAKGDRAAVTRLLARGASVNARTEDDRTLLAVAAARGDVPMARLLIERHADVDLQCHPGETALCIAAGEGRLAMVKLLVAAKADIDAFRKYTPPIGAAAASGHLAVVKYLADHGANLNPREGRDPPLALASELGQVAAVKLLIARGANVDLAGYNTTPLMRAAREHHRDVVRALMEAGASPYLLSYHGDTAASLADEETRQLIRKLTAQRIDHLPPLLQHARELRLGRLTSAGQYGWLNDHELLVCRHAYEDGNGPCTAYRLDLRTGRGTPLSALDALCFGKGQPGTVSFEPSPDGRWLMWFAYPTASGSDPPTAAIHVARLDGTAHAVLKPRAFPTDVHWTPDSRSVAVARLNTQRGEGWVEVQDVAAPKAVRWSPLKCPRLPGKGEADFIGVLPGGRMLFSASSTVPKVGMVECLIDLPALPNDERRASTRALPAALGAGDGLTMRVSCLSPDGRRIAFMLLTEGEVRDEMALIVCDADGQHVHALGTIRLLAHREWDQEGSLAWLPDSKRVSFLYDGRYWSVPVE